MTDGTSPVLTLFPKPALTPLPGIPSHESLLVLQVELNSNASSIHSDSGNGLLGHLVLTENPAIFQAMPGFVAYPPPDNPGPNPIHPPGSTAPQIQEINRLHLVLLRIYRLYHAVDKALVQQLLAAVDPLYVDALCHPRHGFTGVTCLHLLTHLWDTYGTITPDALDANQTRLMAPWHPPTAIEALYTQLERGARFAETAGEAIPELTLVRTGYNLVVATGLFHDACREWRMHPGPKTFPAFKAHFSRHDADRRMTLTTQSAGYHAANAVTTPAVLPTVFTAAQQSALTSAIAAALATRANPASTPNTTHLATMGWCWTHGSSYNTSHTSLTCRKRADNHQETATVENKMGGSTRVSRFPPRPRA